MMSDIYVVGHWNVKPGQEDAFKKAWADIARPTFERFSGSTSVVLLQDTTSPLRFMSMGAWRGRGSIEVWRSSPEFADAVERIKPMLESFEAGTLAPVFSYGQFATPS